MAEPAMNIFGVKPVLGALGLPVASYYRRRRSGAQKPTSRVSGAFRELADDEKKTVLQVLHEPRFVDRAPAEIFAMLLDEGKYYCSVRTMYRYLNENGEVRERRDQLRHPEYVKPELMATAPNQLWSWDITKLKTYTKLVYLYLYVILDVFSRYVVGWMLAEHENAKLACRLVEETYDKQGVQPGQIALHSDRGSPMKSHSLAQLLATLDVEPSFSRPHVSDDNPYSESQFKTLKYHPGFPNRFAGPQDGLQHCRTFFPWYNEDHRHSGIAYLTPSDVHHGRAAEVIARRQQVLDDAYRAHPERFPRGVPTAQQLPPAVWINPPAPDKQPANAVPVKTEVQSTQTQANVVVDAIGIRSTTPEVVH
jgi:putative transposase